MKNTYILLYDGDCGFCNHWVRWVLDNNRKGRFNFAPLQGTFAQSFLKQNHLPNTNFNTLYLIHPKGKIAEKSDAVINICKVLDGVYSIAIIAKVLPKFFRDWIYDLVAKNRKKLMANNCVLLTKDERQYFLE